MAFASILTMIRPDSPDTAITSALGICADAHLMVLVVGKAPAAPSSAYEMVNSDVWLEATQEVKDWAKRRGDEIEALLQSRGQRGEVSAHVAGPVHLADLIAAACRCTDLVLLPAGEDRERTLDHAILTGALFESGTPVLTFEETQLPTAAPGIAVVAWNANPEGARAVRASLPLLKAAEKVQLVLVDPEPGARAHGADPGVDLARYLGHHGVSSELIKMPSERRPVEDVIRGHVRAVGADLLVMGAYGHSRLRERIFGGTTQTVLEAPPCPVLLSH